MSSLELLASRRASRRGSAGFGRRRWGAQAAAERDGLAPVRLWRYLPLVALTTVSVIVLPAALVAAVVPRGGSLLMGVSAAAAVAVSVAIASAEAALWKRLPRSRDLVFADLMLWGWLRRCWTERRLAQARARYDSARKAGPTVSIELLERLSRLLEARDAYTHGHSQRVARHAAQIARAMHLSAVEIAKIRTAATVHDVGKLHTPREILNNPGRLADAEYEIVKRHPGDGADMLAAVGDPEIAAMVRHHHERMDGRGYPAGLLGSEIPLGARIIAVADTFDAIVSSRSYRSAGTHKKALDILSREAGSQLDGAAVATFISRYSARRSVAWIAFATAVPQRIFAVLQSVSPSLGASAGGAASILPALGAAGLLVFSPGLRHDAPAAGRHSHRQAVAVAAQPRQPGFALAPTTTAVPRHETRRTASARPTSPGHRPSPLALRVSPAPPCPPGTRLQARRTAPAATRAQARRTAPPAAPPQARASPSSSRPPRPRPHPQRARPCPRRLRQRAPQCPRRHRQ